MRIRMLTTEEPSGPTFTFLFSGAKTIQLGRQLVLARREIGKHVGACSIRRHHTALLLRVGQSHGDAHERGACIVSHDTAQLRSLLLSGIGAYARQRHDQAHDSNPAHICHLSQSLNASSSQSCERSGGGDQSRDQPRLRTDR